jgi:hypothetical protein
MPKCISCAVSEVEIIEGFCVGIPATLSSSQNSTLRNIWQSTHNFKRDCRTLTASEWWSWHSASGVQWSLNTKIHRISRMNDIAQKQLWRILLHDAFCTLKGYKTSYQGIMIIGYDFMKGCIHDYTRCLIFCLLEMTLPSYSWAHKNWHEVEECNLCARFS